MLAAVELSRFEIFRQETIVFVSNLRFVLSSSTIRDVFVFCLSLSFIDLFKHRCSNQILCVIISVQHARQKLSTKQRKCKRCLK